MAPTSTFYEVRVGFGYKGYSSLVGRDSINLADQYEQSMNFEGYDLAAPQELEFTSVVLHEFGHAFGFHHEHQNPESTCEDDFDWPSIYTYLKGPPNKWSEATINFNLRRLVNDGRYEVVGPFDGKSIMLYQFPPWMYKQREQSECYVAAENVSLSPGDKAAMKEAYSHDAESVAQKRTIDTEKLRAGLRSAPINPGSLNRAFDQLNAIVSEDLSPAARRGATERLMAPNP